MCFKRLRLEPNSIFEAFLLFLCSVDDEWTFTFFFLIWFFNYSNLIGDVSSEEDFSSIVFVVYFSSGTRKHFLRQQSYFSLPLLHSASSGLWFLSVCSGASEDNKKTRLKIINLLRSIEKHICSSFFHSLLSNLLSTPFRLLQIHVCCSSYSHPRW